MSYASDTLSIFTDCCAPHEPREQSGCASFPPSSSASPEATGSLLAEEHATAVEQQTKMSIRIFGFDSAAAREGQLEIPVEQYTEMLGKLKPQFMNMLEFRTASAGDGVGDGIAS